MIRCVRPGRLTAAAVILLCGLSRSASAQTPPAAIESSVDASRLSFRFNVDYFLQISSRQSFPYSDERFADHETFLWERLRPRLTISSPRVGVVLEGQDTHSRGSTFAVRRAWLDLLNAYVDVKQMHGFSVRVGRRQGDFDTITRLVRTPDFAAVVRSFDVAEVGWQRRGTDVRAFAFRTVDNLPDRFNTWKKGERLWTTFAKQTIGRQQVQTYVTARLNTGVVSEDGIAGSGAVYAWEVLAAGRTPIPRVGYQFEHILERGHASTDKVRASGAFGSLTVTPKPGHDIETRYVRLSGDERRGEGQLRPVLHGGGADERPGADAGQQRPRDLDWRPARGHAAGDLHLARARLTRHDEG